MAAIVKCDGCCKCVEPKNAMHVRTYTMSSATTYNSGDAKQTGDLCKECYDKLLVILGKGAK